MNLSQIHQSALAVAVASMFLGSASASTIFEGRLANGAASNTCTVSGAGKCAMFYNNTLDITILNNWSIGQGFWNAAGAAGSAQALAALAGFSATGLTGWVLPTASVLGGGPSAQQYISIRNDAGGSFASLQSQFDGVQSGAYWSATEFVPNPLAGAVFFDPVSGSSNLVQQSALLYAAAVRPGDVTAVPEPGMLALVLAGLGAVVVAVRRRSASPTI